MVIVYGACLGRTTRGPQAGLSRSPLRPWPDSCPALAEGTPGPRVAAPLSCGDTVLQGGPVLLAGSADPAG